MIEVNQIQALRQQVLAWRRAGDRIGFVPTMGNLHAGHLSLVDQAKKVSDKVVVSIFVNPLQFGPEEDFDRYPRTQEADCRKLVEAGVDMVFLPSVSEMYPSGQVQTLVKAPDMLTTVLEGAQRPGHFDGVTTVVSKLFNIVQPDVAVFGQKDFQQWRVIQQMAVDLSMPIEIIRAPIERDRDGLALSSRNQYLTAEQRQVAPKLFVTLQDVKAAVLSGNTAYSQLESAAVQQLLESGFDRVDYVKIVSQQQLSPAGPEDAKLVILAVARLGATRLLDNIALTLTGENT